MLPRAAGVTLFFFLGAGLACAFGRDPTLMEARLSERAGDRAEAARLCASWLKGNPGSTEAPVVFLHYAGLEQNLQSLIEQGTPFLQASKGGIQSSTATMLVARLFEVAGRTEEARNAYLTALRGGESIDALEAAFLLSVEMNDVNALQSALDTVKEAGGERIDFLRACLSFQEGGHGPSSEALLRIAGSTTDPDIALRALWMSYEISRRAGDSRAMAEAVKRLQERFPRSPEYLMAQAGGSAKGPGPNVSPVELPGKFLADGDTSSASVDKGSGQEPDAKPSQPSTLSVQAGSFQMKENADDLVSELARKGFSPSLRVDSSQGNQLFRVMAGTALTPEDARLLLDKLHAAGLSGYLLRDQ